MDTQKKDKVSNDRTLKALMKALLANDEADDPKAAGEVLTEFAVSAGLFGDLANYVEYELERERLLEKFKRDFRLRTPSFSWGGEGGYAFSPGTWTNEGLGRPGDRIMPELAESLIGMYNAFVRRHPDFDQTRLVRNEADPFFGMKFESTEGNEDRTAVYTKVVDVLYRFFYGKGFDEGVREAGEELFRRAL